MGSSSVRCLLLALILIILGTPLCAEHFFLVKKSGEVLMVDSQPMMEGNFVCFDLGESRECLPVAEVDLDRTYIVPDKNTEHKLRRGTPGKVYTNEDIEPPSAKPRESPDENDPDEKVDLSTLPIDNPEMEKFLEEFQNMDALDVWRSLPGRMKAFLIIGTILALLLQAALFALLLAQPLRWAVRIILKFDITFGSAYKLTFIATILTNVINGIVYFLLACLLPPTPQTSLLLLLESTAASILLPGVVYFKLIPVRPASLTGFAKAVLIALLQYLFLLLVLLLIALVILLIIVFLF